MTAELVAAVLPIDTLPPEPVAAPAANVTVAFEIVQLGGSVAPVGEVARTQLFTVIVLGPTYPPVPVAVIAEVPGDPGVTETEAAANV